MNPSPKPFLKTLTADQLIAVESLRARFAQLPDRRMPARIIHRIDDTEPGGPAQRTEAIEDPTPINDPGIEVPEVVPIDPEELPVVDEP